MAVAVIGWSDIGKSVVTRFLAGGVADVRVHAALPPGDEVVFPDGVRACSTPAEAAAGASAVLLTLPRFSKVLEVIRGDTGISRALGEGTLVWVMTPGTAFETKQAAAVLAPDGARVVDVAVGSGLTDLAEGQGVLIVGGDRPDVEMARSLLTILAGPDHIHHVGTLGSAQVVGSANAFLNAMHRWISIEAVAMATSAGIPVRRVLEILAVGAASNRTILDSFPRFILHAKKEGIPLDLLIRQLHALNQMAVQDQLSLPLAQELEELYRIAAAVTRRPSGEDLEASSVIELYEEWANVVMVAPAGEG